MRYLIVVAFAAALFFGYSMTLYSQEKAAQPAPSHEEIAAKKKQIAEIQGKMRAIERQVASQD